MTMIPTPVQDGRLPRAAGIAGTPAGFISLVRGARV